MTVQAGRPAAEGVADRTLPPILRILLVGIGLVRLGFGLTLLVNPAAIGTVWPWPMSPLASRLLGASTLVSAPLGLVPGLANRWRVARIPILMMLSYRVGQLAAGALHYSRFDFSSPTTWNYFGGGGLMMLVLAYALWRGDRLGEPIQDPGLLEGGPLSLGPIGRVYLQTVAVAFFALGVFFFVLGSGASPAWMEAEGRLTPLTARLFASPMIGLALGIWALIDARAWREAAVPAIGFVTFGLAGSYALVASRAELVPPSPAGFIPALSPGLLLVAGIYVLSRARRGARLNPRANRGAPLHS